jgi:membrane fusion protein (multidrug efflux system)
MARYGLRSGARVALVLGLLLAPPAALGQQTPAAIPVGATPAQLRAVNAGNEFVGRVEAVERVEVRARVTGFVKEVAFKEGSQVKAGDVLYKIEPDTFEAALQHAKGALVEAQGRYANATAQLARTQELVKTDAASRALLDVRVAEQTAAQGQVIVADANLKTATVNLGYTVITAPIGGEVGRTHFTVGNVVGPDSGPLTVIVSRDPMYVTFPVSQREFLALERSEQKKDLQKALTVRIRFSDGSLYDQVGHINFIDVTVNRETDTVLVRATIPNPAGKLIDGQLVRVAVETEKPTEKVLVPQTALVIDQQGPYVFIVEDGKAVVRRLKLGGEFGPYVIVEEGLKGGEQVVVQGSENLRPGAAVSASPVPPPADGS